MNKHDLAAAIEAARKNMEQAQQELARLEAIKLNYMPPMVIDPERAPKHGSFFVLDRYLTPFEFSEDYTKFDDQFFSCGNYFHTKEQADAYCRAISTLLLIRRQPGIVGYEPQTRAWNIDVKYSEVLVKQCLWSSLSSIYMFPCFESESTARAAVEAVGADNLIFTARFLAGAE